MAVIDFWELAGYPVEEHEPKKFQAQRRLLCRWSDRYALKQRLMGWPGQLYPYIGDTWWNRCTAISIEPFGILYDSDGEYLQDGTVTNNSLAVYEWAIMTAKYESPDIGSPSANTGTEASAMSESLEPTIETSILAYDKFRWSNGDALRPDEAPVRHMLRMNYVMTRHYLPAIPSTIVDLVGHINSVEVKPKYWPDITFPVHTLMFVAPNIEQTISPSGKQSFEVTYRFSYKEEGWRRFFRPDALPALPAPQVAGIYDTMEVKVGANWQAWENPPEADFNVLYN